MFCRLAESGPPSLDNLVVWRGDWSFVVLNAYPYGSGHVLVLPLRHVGALGDLTEAGGGGNLGGHPARTRSPAIERAYEPDGLNMGANLGRAAGAESPTTSTSTSAPLVG